MNTSPTMRIAPTAMALIFVAALGGCVTTPVPTAQLAVADAAVQHANTSSTSQDAPAELQIAIAKLASAQQAETNRDYERAIQLAQEAQVDAQFVRVLVAQLRQKLELEPSSPRLVLTEPGVGYRLKAEDDA